MSTNKTEQRVAATATKSTGQERRGFKAELRVSGDAARPKITGMAALYNVPSQPIGGQFIEVLAAGSFRDVLSRPLDVLALLNHDANYVLGRSTAGTLKLSETARGLAVEIDPPDAQWAKDLIVSMKRGDIHQMSFSFNLEAGDAAWTEEKDGTQRRTIKRIAQLWDVSVVSRPAYRETSATARKHSGAPMTLAEVKRRYAATGARLASLDRRTGYRPAVATAPFAVSRELAESRARRQRLADRARRDPLVAFRTQLAERWQERKRAEGNISGAILNHGVLQAPW